MRATAPCTLRLTDAHCGCRTSDVLTRVHFQMIKGARLATTSRSHRPQALPACHRRKARSSCTTNSGFASMAREMFQTDGLQLQLEQRQICVRTHTYILTCVHIHMHIPILNVCMYACMYVSMYVCTYVPMYLCIYVYMYLCIYVSMCIHDAGLPHPPSPPPHGIPPLPVKWVVVLFGLVAFPVLVVMSSLRALSPPPLWGGACGRSGWPRSACVGQCVLQR